MNPNAIARNLPCKRIIRLCEAEAGRPALEQRAADIAAVQNFAFEALNGGRGQTC